MPIEFDCRVCGRRLRTPDGTEGKEAKCPACETVQTIPGTPEAESPPPSPGGPPPAASPAVPPSGDVYGRSSVPPPPPPPSPSAGAPAGDPSEPSAYGPQAGMPGEVAGSVFVPSRIDAGDVLNRAWAVFKVQWAMIILVVIVGGIIIMGINYALTFGVVILEAGGVDEVVIAMTQLFNGLFVQLVSLWIGLGIKSFLIRTGRGEPVGFSELFAGGRYLVPAILASVVLMFGAAVIVSLFALPLFLFMAIVGADEVVAIVVLALAAMVALPIWFYLAIRFSQYQYLVIDRYAGPIECLSLSWQITRGNVLSIFLVWLVTAAINLLGLLACCVGLIATAPFSSFIYAVQYLALTGQPTADQLWHAAAPPDHSPVPPPGNMPPPSSPPT